MKGKSSKNPSHANLLGEKTCELTNWKKLEHAIQRIHAFNRTQNTLPILNLLSFTPQSTHHPLRNLYVQFFWINISSQQKKYDRPLDFLNKSFPTKYVYIYIYISIYIWLIDASQRAIPEAPTPNPTPLTATAPPKPRLSRPSLPVVPSAAPSHRSAVRWSTWPSKMPAAWPGGTPRWGHRHPVSQGRPPG